MQLENNAEHFYEMLFLHNVESCIVVIETNHISLN